MMPRTGILLQVLFMNRRKPEGNSTQRKLQFTGKFGNRTLERPKSNTELFVAFPIGGLAIF